MKDVTMPKLSDTMTEGTVVAWRKAAGERVERGEVIAEVETDKATMELEAFASGVLLEIRVEAGTTVPVGTVIGVIGAPDEAPAAANEQKDVAKEETGEREAKASGGAADGQKSGDTVGVRKVEEASAGKQDAAARQEGPVPADEDEKEGAEEEAGGGAVRAAPVVRRRARELGIDLAAVTGSGPGGRILLEDLEPARGGGNKTPAAPQPPPAEAQPVVTPAGEPLSRMRAAIARTVSESWRTIPHFQIMVEVRMDAAEQFLRRLREEGTKVSLTALLTSAVAKALKEFPKLNASLFEERLVIHPACNIGIVVRQGEGLLVPIIHDCAAQSLTTIAERTAQLVERARGGRLSATELSGGTFAISNLGMYGVDDFVALILPPMAAVLAVGAVRDGVTVQEGRPAVARLLALTLSADHRVVDGAYAAEFLQAVKQLLEEPSSLATA